jgi:Flp pilus assembly protein TadD
MSLSSPRKTFSFPRWFYWLAAAAAVYLQSGCGIAGKPNPEDERARMGRDMVAAHAALDEKRYEEAKGLLAPWAAEKVRDPQVYAMLAKAQWKSGESDAAVSNYEEAMRLDYSDAIVHLELAELLVEMGKTGRSLTEFELAIEFGQRDPLTHYNYGLALREMGRIDDCLAQWEIAYSLDPASATYAEALGIGYAGTDDEKALTYFERAAALGAGSAGFHNNFGLLLQRLGDYERAGSEFAEALALDPDNLDYVENHALLLMVSGRFEDAAPSWQALLAADPEDATARIYLARSYLETGQYDNSIQLLGDWVTAVPARRDGKTLGPGIDEAWGILAMARRGRGDLSGAEEDIRKALDLKPDNPVFLNNYGVILAENGKIAEARAQWEKVLRLDPDNATARQNLSAFEP